MEEGCFQEVTTKDVAEVVKYMRENMVVTFRHDKPAATVWIRGAPHLVQDGKVYTNAGWNEITSKWEPEPEATDYIVFFSEGHEALTKKGNL